MKDQKLFTTLHDLFDVSALESDMDEIKRAIQADIENENSSFQKRECVCITECLGCYHKDAKCKKLKGYYG